jgi:hypothetical protein
VCININHDTVNAGSISCRDDHDTANPGANAGSGNGINGRFLQCYHAIGSR